MERIDWRRETYLDHFERVDGKTRSLFFWFPPFERALLDILRREGFRVWLHSYRDKDWKLLISDNNYKAIVSVPIPNDLRDYSYEHVITTTLVDFATKKGLIQDAVDYLRSPGGTPTPINRNTVGSEQGRENHVLNDPAG